MSKAEHGGSFHLVSTGRVRRPWCTARHASKRRCNTVVKKRGDLCRYHQTLVAEYVLEAARLQRSGEQQELKQFLKSYRYLNRYAGSVAEQVLDSSGRISVRQAKALGRIAAKEAWTLSDEYRAGRMPETVGGSS